METLRLAAARCQELDAALTAARRDSVERSADASALADAVQRLEAEVSSTCCGKDRL